LKKHIISSHKCHYNKIIKNFPDRNFFDVINYLKKNTTFPFVNFKEETVNTNDTTDKEYVGKKENFEKESRKVDLYFLFILIEKYLFLQSLLNSSIYDFMNDYNKFVNALRRNNYFSFYNYKESYKSNFSLNLGDMIDL
jgi:hypothetical protein